MKTRSHLTTICLFFLAWIVPSTPVHAGHNNLAPLQEETPTPIPTAPTPAEIIDAVNNLRIAHGLIPLTAHPILMQVASEQANALAASEGTVGHERPCGMTLGQQLLMMGFPLWGDLSLDGYRSENWVTASTSEEAISFWLSDDEHTNTMLSPNRSDIGAAVAVSNQIYVVLETALQTRSGQMQYGADVILTGIPMTQSACLGLATQLAEYGELSQYPIPVAISTARPDGDVFHEVKYGQTLWSLADQYKVSVEQIKLLNNLSEDTIVPGWKLLVQKGATQPAPVVVTSSSFDATKISHTPTVAATATAVITPVNAPTGAMQFVRQNSTVVVAFIISLSVLIAGLVGRGKRKE